MWTIINNLPSTQMEISPSQFIVPLTEQWGVRELVSTRSYVKLLSQLQVVNEMYLKPTAWQTFPQIRSYNWVASINGRLITLACTKMENVWRDTINYLWNRWTDGEIPQLSYHDEIKFDERAKHEFNDFEFPPLADWWKFRKQILEYCWFICLRCEPIIFGKDESKMTVGNLSGQFDMLCGGQLMDLKMGTPDPTTDVLQLLHYAMLVHSQNGSKMFDKYNGAFEECNRNVSQIELFYPMYDTRLSFPIDESDLIKLKRFLLEGTMKPQLKMVIVDSFPIVQHRNVPRISTELSYIEFMNDPWIIQSGDDEFFKWYEGVTLSIRKMKGGTKIKKGKIVNCMVTERFQIIGYKTKIDALNAATLTLGDYGREQYKGYVSLFNRPSSIVKTVVEDLLVPLSFIESEIRPTLEDLISDSWSNMSHDTFVDKYIDSYIKTVKRDYNTNMKHVGEFDVLSYPRAHISSVIQKLEELLVASLSPSVIVDGLVINWSSDPIPRRVKYTYFRVDPRIDMYTDEEFFRWYGGAKIISCKDRKRFPWIPNYVDISSFCTKAEALEAISKL